MRPAGPATHVAAINPLLARVGTTQCSNRCLGQKTRHWGVSNQSWAWMKIIDPFSAEMICIFLKGCLGPLGRPMCHCSIMSPMRMLNLLNLLLHLLLACTEGVKASSFLWRLLSGARGQKTKSLFESLCVPYCCNYTVGPQCQIGLQRLHSFSLQTNVNSPLVLGVYYVCLLSHFHRQSACLQKISRQ